MATAQSARLGFIGLGAMGYHMSANLTKAGAVSVWNRNSAVAEQHQLEHNTTAVRSLSDFANHDVGKHSKRRRSKCSCNYR